MRCLRTHHPVLIYSLFAFFASVLFCVFGLSQESYATSLNCTLSGTRSSNSIVSSSFSSCFDYDSSLIYPYVKFNSVSFSFTSPASLTGSSSVSSNGINISTIQGSSLSNSSYSLLSFFPEYTSDNPTWSKTFDYDVILPAGQFMSGPNLGSTYDPFRQRGIYTGAYTNFFFSFSYNITIATSLSDLVSGNSTECEVCQECPVIPDNPYDQKLDNITKAIYVCGAILIMLYFFFCIYKIIVKDGGSR